MDFSPGIVGSSSLLLGSSPGTWVSVGFGSRLRLGFRFPGRIGGIVGYSFPDSVILAEFGYYAYCSSGLALVTSRSKVVQGS